MKKVDILVGLQYGSEGKGLIAGHLAHTGFYDTVVNVNMPNAGHTYINSQGKWVFKVLPNGAVSPHIKRVMLGPDSVFSYDRLMEEIALCPPGTFGKLIIHEGAALLQPEHAIHERHMVDSIGSTGQGSSVAMMEKIARSEHGTVGQVRPEGFEDNIVTNAEWMEILHDDADRILLEGCQGYSLGLNAGFYPYCTSRDCTPGRLLAGAGIPHTWADKVIGAARIYPIRVGGNSGPCYPDQVELDWASIGVAPELTTVTQRVRRLFTFSRLQMIEAVQACQPNKVFLNFCNYDPEESNNVIRSINSILSASGPDQSRVHYTGWGPKDIDIRYE